jgi:predicted DNA-binding transcriptional regulator AlpA
MTTSRLPRDTEALLVEVHAADLLGLSSRTLQSWRSKREGPPFIRVGRAIRYRRQALLEWAMANTVHSKNSIVPEGRAPNDESPR